MTIYMAPPDGSTILVGHNVYEVELGNYFIVTDKKNFEIRHEEALTAGQHVDSIQLTELKSSEAEVYWLESISLINNIKLWMKYRDKEMFSTNVKSYLDLNISNIVSPFNINKWMYNYTPTAEMTEMANLAVTANIHFKGITFELRKYRPDIAADLKVIDDIKANKVKCWNVRG